MTKTRTAAVAAALTVGPFTAYLVWAITGRRWGHAVVAAVGLAALVIVGGDALVVMARDLLRAVHVG